MELTYKGKTYRASNVDEIIRQLRIDHHLSYRDIGKVVRRSHTYVRNILEKVHLAGYITFPELDRPEIFEKSDEEISSTLGIPVSRVTQARKKLGVKGYHKVRIQDRRRELAKFLFGKEYRPGPTFINFLADNLSLISERKAELINEFYILGTHQALSDQINLDSDRVYRCLARKDLKKALQDINPRTLLDKGVLNDGISGDASQ